MQHSFPSALANGCWRGQVTVVSVSVCSVASSERRRASRLPSAGATTDMHSPSSSTRTARSSISQVLEPRRRPFSRAWERRSQVAVSQPARCWAQVLGFALAAAFHAINAPCTMRVCSATGLGFWAGGWVSNILMAEHWRSPCCCHHRGCHCVNAPTSWRRACEWVASGLCLCVRAWDSHAVGAFKHCRCRWQLRKTRGSFQLFPFDLRCL
jgi:hypothetical protein